MSKSFIDLEQTLTILINPKSYVVYTNLIPVLREGFSRYETSDICCGIYIIDLRI